MISTTRCITAAAALSGAFFLSMLPASGAVIFNDPVNGLSPEVEAITSFDSTAILDGTSTSTAADPTLSGFFETLAFAPGNDFVVEFSDNPASDDIFIQGTVNVTNATGEVIPQLFVSGDLSTPAGAMIESFTLTFNSVTRNVPLVGGSFVAEFSMPIGATLPLLFQFEDQPGVGLPIKGSSIELNNLELSAVPEPSALLVVLLGVGGFLLRRRA